MFLWQKCSSIAHIGHVRCGAWIPVYDLILKKLNSLDLAMALEWHPYVSLIMWNIYLPERPGKQTTFSMVPIHSHRLSPVPDYLVYHRVADYLVYHRVTDYLVGPLSSYRHSDRRILTLVDDSRGFPCNLDVKFQVQIEEVKQVCLLKNFMKPRSPTNGAVES